jgi:long-chain acyl-CoA synthetase
MKSVLLAGSIGMAAAHLYRILAAKRGILIQVAACDGCNRTAELQEFTGIQPASIASTSDASDIDVLYHFPHAETPRICRHCLDLLARNGRMRFVHLSSAYVAGTRQGLFTEFDLECGQRFHDSWERAHYDIELLLRRSPAADRITIVRASLLLGDSRDGCAFAFTGPYTLLRRLRLRFPICGDRTAPLDVVPADYVARMLVAAGEFPGRTLHAVAGYDDSLRLAEFAAVAAGYGRGHIRRTTAILPPITAPLLSRGFPPDARAALRHSPVFDAWFTRSAVPLVFPPVRSWLGKVIDFAEAHCWNTAAVPCRRVLSVRE